LSRNRNEYCGRIGTRIVWRDRKEYCTRDRYEYCTRDKNEYCMRDGNEYCRRDRNEYCIWQRTFTGGEGVCTHCLFVQNDKRSCLYVILKPFMIPFYLVIVLAADSLIIVCKFY
jgi:hypothetical protein